MGGTTSRLGLFMIGRESIELEGSLELKTAAFSSFFNLLKKAAEIDLRFSLAQVQGCVFAVPGPLEDEDVVVLTNVEWTIPVAVLRKQYPQISIEVVNDFVAQSYGCLAAQAEDMEVVQYGVPRKMSPLAVIGAGTGLGHSALFPWRNEEYIPVASEAGHTLISFYEKEKDFELFLKKRLSVPYITKEMAVSGRGLSLLHLFLTGRELSSPAVVAEISSTSLTTYFFASFYARACRDFALTILPMHGLFISGGVAVSNPWLVNNDFFREEFNFSLTHSSLLSRIPLYVLLREDMGLWGAARYGYYRFNLGEQTTGSENPFSYW
ncbi:MULTISPECIES: glucokinase [Aminobacterium]|uniref:glucokinase n=1 Tax=Aminobacterium TaxID=81466 RepID=UPI002377F4C7|nr:MULTISPECIES: glucokinase [Aminobacterium]